MVHEICTEYVNQKPVSLPSSCGSRYVFLRGQKEKYDVLSWVWPGHLQAFVPDLSVSLQKYLWCSRFYTEGFEKEALLIIVSSMWLHCLGWRVMGGESGLSDYTRRCEKAGWGTRSACASDSVPQWDAEGAEFASEGLAASCCLMCFSETVKVAKAWTTSVRSSSFILLLARK